MKRFVAHALNCVDYHAPDYSGWEGSLTGCIGDAGGWASVAASAGVAPQSFLSGYMGRMTSHGSALPDYEKLEATTRANFRLTFNEIEASQPGDFWIVLYSGHVAQVQYGFERVESFCFYDGLLDDREFWDMLCKVPKGVRLWFIGDGCHMGGMPGARSTVPIAPQGHYGPFNKSKACPIRFRGMDAPRPRSRQPVGDILFWAGCRTNQTAMDGPHNGLFTATALSLAKPDMTYGSLAGQIIDKMPSHQTPEMFCYGNAEAWARPVFT